MSRIAFLLCVTHLLCLYFTIINADFNRLEFCEHVSLYGVTCETHYITTEDGYILGIQRIGNGQPEKISSTPVLIWHGAICSADSLVIMGNESTPVQLALAGYDVWMGNSRGNKYSRNHTTLNPDINGLKFWDFSFHEMAIYDVPVTVDYILNETGQQKLTAIGHSQGTTIFFVLGSQIPKYNEKIQLIAMAPVAYMNTFPLISIIRPIITSTVVELIAIRELLAADSVETYVLQLACSQNFLSSTCVDILGGPYEDGELTDEIYHDILSYYFGGVSAKTGNHFLQLIANGLFTLYDHGEIGNIVKYKSLRPPEYKLENVTMPVVMLVGANDMVTKPKEVSKLRNRLQNVVSYKEIDDPKYNHLGFLAGKSMPTVLNELIFDLLANYPTKTVP